LKDKLKRSQGRTQMGNSLLLLLRAYRKCRFAVFLRGCILIKATLIKATLFLILACLQTSLAAQQTSELKAAAPENIEIKADQQAPLDLSVGADGNVTEKGDVLRLEETIRGNKEQPTLLSIVPWQLPLYQRIDRNEELWKPINTRLKPIERGSFLKEIQLIEELQAGHSGVQVDTKSN
jgi:hypothetical protein